MMKSIVAFGLVLLFVLPVFGQKKKKRSQYFTKQSYQYPLYKWTGDYSRHGIQFNFGPTYLLTHGESPERDLATSPDTSMTYTHNPSGRLGGFIEIGMVHIAKKRRKVIHYYDWGIGYKHFAGAEQTRLMVHRLGATETFNGNGVFDMGYLYARFNVHNVWQINKDLFLDNALGFNVDYRLVGSVPGDNSRYDGAVLPQTQRFQQDLVAQLNYELGLGIKVRDGFFIIPSIHTPIFGIAEWTGGNPSLMWYSSRYQPLLAKVKFVWLFKSKNNGCPPVFGSPEDEKRNQQFLDGQ